MTDLKEQTAQNKLAKKVEIRNYAELVNLGHDCIEQKKFDFALKILMQAIQLDANGYEAYFERGRYYFYMENYELALGDFNKAIQLNPNFSKAYRAIGVYYKKQNNDELYFEYFKKAAELEDAISQYRTSLNYKYGWGVEKNLELAFEWLNKSAEQGNIDAQYSIAIDYLYGFDIEKNPELAFEWFKKAAEQGNIEAQYELAKCYFYGKGTWGNSVFGFEWCKKAAEQGNIEAQYELADCYLNGIGIEKNPELGFELLNKLAEQDNIKAQYLLADCYLKGMGIEKNVKLGFELLKKLAEQGDEESKWKLIRYFLHDKEIETLEEELQWFEKKAEQGDIEAYYLLSQVYFKGIKVKKNRILALEWLEKSLTQEKSNKYRLADIFLDFAYGFESDNSELEISEQKIIDLYIKAAEYGSANACIRLADYYRLGHHVEKNDALAFEYYKKSYEMAIKKNEPFGEYPDIISLASEQLSSYYAEGKIVKKDTALAEFYQKQIIVNKDAINFPYKSSLDYWLDELSLTGNEKVHYLISKGRFDEAKETIQNNDDIDTYALSIDYVDAKLEEREKYKKIECELKEVKKELEEKNKALELKYQQNESLQNRMQKLVEQFTHSLGNVIFPDTIYQVAERLKNNPECRKDVLLLHEAYHSEIIIKLQGELLRQRYANTNPEKFRQFIRSCRRLPNNTDNTKSIEDILDYAASRVTARFLNQHYAGLNTIRNKILANKSVDINALKQKFEDELLLNKSSRPIIWINQNLRPVQITELSPLWKKVCILAESHAEALLFGYFSEILFNAFKYADHDKEEFLTLIFDESVINDKTYLTCHWKNPVKDNTPLLGTGKGLDAIQEDLKQLNDTENPEQSLFINQQDNQFEVTLFFNKDLLIDDLPILTRKRK